MPDGTRLYSPTYNKEGVRRYQSTPRGRAVRLAISARMNAKKAGIAHDLDADWVEARIRAGCAKTGVAFELKHPGGTGFSRCHHLSPSLDRIDPTKGYTKDNVQVVTWIYNRAKHQQTDADVLEFAKALVRAHGGDHL
jgi:hypothetical protein